MQTWKNYLTTMSGVIEKIRTTQGEAIMQAADILTKTTENDGIIYGFGVGHSYHVIGDAFWRASTRLIITLWLNRALPAIMKLPKATKSRILMKSAVMSSIIIGLLQMTA